MGSYKSLAIEQAEGAGNEIEQNINIWLQLQTHYLPGILSFTNAAMTTVAFKRANIND